MGLLDSIFGGGSGSADDPYADILTPAQRNHMQAQGLLAMAGAFAQAGMPSRLPVPFGSALGSAAAALGTGQEAGMKTAIENALAAQKVRDLRNTAEFRKKFFGDQDALGKAIEQILRPTGTAATPGAPSSGGAAPPAGTYAGPGTPAGAGGGGLLSPDFSLGSDYASGLTPDPTERTSRFNVGLLDYPSAGGTMRAGGGLVREEPGAGLGTATPSSDYAPGGKLYPFKDLGVVPGAGGGGAPAAAASQQSAAPGGGIIVDGVRYPNARAWREAVDAREAADRSGSRFNLPAAGEAPTPVPEVTSVPGGTNGIDPRKRAALDAILGGMQTAQAGPSAGRLPQFAGPGAADAPADTVPEGGGLLGVAPDLRAPIEANPLARVNAVLGQIRQRESAGNYAIPPEQNVDFPRSHASGGYQFQPGTWRDWTAKSGFGREYPEAYLAPPPVQDAVARYAALHGDVNAMSLWGASAGNRPYPNPQEGGGGPLPPDEVIPSGPGAGGGLPPVVRAQYAAPGGGGAAMPAAPGAAPPAAGMPGGPPQYPSAPPAGNQAAVSTLLLELARRNAAAEVLGMGNPYGSLLTVLQGSPQYKAQVEAATEQAKRTVGLGFIKEEKRLGAEGELPSLITRDASKAVLDQINKQIEQMGAAALDLTTIKMRDANGQVVERPATRAQAAAAAAGFSVPELNLKGMYGPAPPGQIPGLSLPGAPGGAAGPAPQAQAITPGAPGTLADTPYNSPSDLKLQETDIKLLDQKRALADTARTTIQNANDLRATIEQGVIAGAGADTRTQMLKLGQLLGITGTDTNQLIANTEKYIASQGKNLKEGLAGLGPPISNQDVAIADRIAGGQMTTPQGMLEILRIREKYHRQAIVDYNQMASRVPVSPIIGDRTVKEPPTYGAQTATGANGERIWKNSDGKWVPF